MPSHPLVDDIRRFVLSFGEHDADCPSIDATAWEQQTALCVCGFAPRLNELIAKLENELAARNAS